jgi:hypothetical protein
MNEAESRFAHQGRALERLVEPAAAGVEARSWL